MRFLEASSCEHDLPTYQVSSLQSRVGYFMKRRLDRDEAHQSDRRATPPDRPRETVLDAIAKAVTGHEYHTPEHLGAVPDSEKSLSRGLSFAACDSVGRASLVPV